MKIGRSGDFETAEIDVKAALAGHVVLSSMHTKDCPGTVNRLVSMGIEPFLISSSLVGIVAQRLVRVLCKECREPYTPTEEHCEFLQQDPANPPTIYRATGCSHCNQLGYRGRIGIYEVVEISEEISSLIHKRAGELDLEKVENINDSMTYGIMRTPGLVVDEKVLVTGRVPSIPEVVSLLSDRL